MREEGTVASTFQAGSNNSFGSNSNGKWGGIIQESTTKKTKRALRSLIDYVFIVTPSYGTLHSVVTIIRLFQILGPALLAPYHDFWQTKDYSQQTVEIASFFFHIVPPQYRDQSYIYLMIIYCIIYGAFEILALIAAFYYKKYANLPMAISYIITIFFASFGYIMFLIGTEFVFEKISQCIFLFEKVNLIETIVLIIVYVLVSSIYLWIFTSFATNTLMFRQNSFMTVCSLPSNLIFDLSMAITIISALGSHAEKYQPYFLLVTAVVYGISIAPLFLKGGLLKIKDSIIYFSACSTGCVFCLIAAIILFLGKTASLVFLIIFIIIFVVFTVIGYFLANKMVGKNLVLLDSIMDDNINIDMIKNPNKFIKICVNGFQHAHPVCLNWHLLKLASDKWPENSLIWFIFAKFVAIYPEETQKLAWIFHTIISLNLHGSEAHTVKEQSLFIARQRESNISLELKTKLNIISKHLTSTKHKLRHVWDLAIQSNISEMEPATKRAIKEIQKSDAEFKHIFRQFPNNRFVSRNYARFCKDVKADYVEFSEMLEATRLLQRGVSVNTDLAHELGVKIFPEIPTRLKTSKDSQFNMTESVSQSTEITIENEEELQNDVDQSQVLRSRIEKVIIPATRYTIFIRIFMFILFFAIPVIAMLIYIPYFIDGIVLPLNHMYNMALLRTYLYMINSFSIYHIYNKLGQWSAPKNNTEKVLTNLGSTWDLEEQLYYIMTCETMMVQDISTFRQLIDDNPKIQECKDQLFGSTIDYTFYINSKEFSTQMISTTAAINDVIIQLSDIVANSSLITKELLNTSVVLNQNSAMKPLGKNLRIAQENMVEYVKQKDSALNSTAMYIMIGIIIFVVIIFTIALIFQLKWLNETKMEVYKCLTSLPKNTVSTLAENLRILKKENDDMSTNNNTDMNKQEDNILKIFMTGGNDTSSSIVDRLLLIFSTIILIGLHIGCTVELVTLMQYISRNNAESSPQLIYLQGAYSMCLAATSVTMFLIEINSSDYRMPLFDEDQILALFEDRTTKMRNYYHLARYGGPDVQDIPYVGFQKGMDYAIQQMECKNRYAIPKGFADATQCYTPELAFILMESITRSRIKPWRTGLMNISWDDTWADAFSIMEFPIWDVFIAPMFFEIVPTIKGNLNSQKNSKIPGIVVMLVISLICELLAIMQTKNIDTHIREVLSLLLHCPPHVVLQTQKIMTILSGDFTSRKENAADRNAEFFEAVVQNLPDAIVVADSNNIIEVVNKSFVRIYGIEVDAIVGKKLNEFYTPSAFDGKLTSLFSNIDKGSNEELVFHKEDGGEINIKVNVQLINQKIVVSTRDITQIVRYNQLIHEEKTKSDFLLASILPPSLVARVQSGEKNISFAVQSATIVFMDIVSFTPWCGSLPADKVMMTLNLMFKKFDSYVARYPTMTKIKCIGDCYMAAGGVFSEVNQPAEHSKDVVSFGLDALDGVLELNQEIGEKLQMRVGINTGGPIVAGVLGIEKPTFEILGPAINMAQQMEHHGVPMAVHVSRSVYELIYGSNFNVKERGSVEVKGGNVITYLVSRKQ